MVFLKALCRRHTHFSDQRADHLVFALSFPPLICFEMDSLIAKADALGKKRKYYAPSAAGPSKNPQSDRTFQSIQKRTSVPRSLQVVTPENAKEYKHIANKKLRNELHKQSAQNSQAKALLEDADLLLTGEAGMMEVEGEMDKTWRVGQSEMAENSGQEAARGRREWKLDGGPYRSRYTRNGRCVPCSFLFVC